MANIPDALRQSRGVVTRFCGAEGVIMIVPGDATLHEVEQMTWWMAAEYVDVVSRAVALEQLPRAVLTARDN